MIYVVKVESGYVVGKSQAKQVGESEYEITQAQFNSLKIPCVATVEDGVVTFGDYIAPADMPPTTCPEPGPLPDDVVAEQVRVQRDSLLTACDWTQMPDCPLDEADKALWADYRQVLRDIPEQEGFPQTVEWPVSPDEG